ncbi:MAG: UbiH/UbiF/VisC/COQ6 family ubiquinone biosynthesis hydroxylase [Ectothiorhodospiraceae bacterium]|nr:UbiH/UbiF/VisC/COQ6 family ubiquinone biosynthesis hydroxylase [Ectothiorhodospiraceae bacterium]
MAERDFDVVINGGGMVGLALALALRGGGLRVALVEARLPEPWRREQMQNRVSSLTLASQRLLERLGVWGALEAARVSPFEAIHAWDAGAGIHFHARDLGEPWLGHIVENGLLQQTLFDAVQGASETTVFAPAAIERVRREDDGTVHIRLDDGRRLRSRLLVGADGARSAVREWAGIGLRQHDYRQRGVVATIRTERHHGLVARQRFLSGGPLALLPLADGRCSIVWSLPEDEAEAVLGMDDEAFHRALGDASQQVLGAVVHSESRAAFPLRAMHAERYVSPGFALVGDAAHVIHPLAGQGVNLGFLDAAGLAQVLVQAAGSGRDPGGLATLRRYERWRRGDNQLMQSAMDGFHWLFSNRDPVRGLVRNLGFALTDRAGPVKRRLMEYAVGLRGDLPALARVGSADPGVTI